MPRAIWSGAISFGLVTIPVKAYPASRDHKVHFHRLQRGKVARVRNKMVSEKTGKEVDSDDIEMGYELSPGKYVTVDPEELDALRPRSTRTLDVADFVELEAIDPIYYERTYWLGPDGEAAEGAYRLLLAAMEDQQRVGIGSVVMRRKQYLAAVRPLDGALAMSTMRFADEVVDKSDIDTIPSRRAKPGKKELALANQIIDSLASDWQPERYHDTYTEELRDLIKRRAEGEDVEVEEAPAVGANVIDLMEALERSVNAARSARGKKAHRAMTKAATDLMREAAVAEDGGDDDSDGDDGDGASRSSTATKRRASRPRSSHPRSSRTKSSRNRSTSSSKRPAKKAATKKTSATRRKSA
jgi:DNA end-binding protein Ku